ncbi:MAG TPA: hypothetical protein VGG56_17800 [Terracidiphilus sp.]|jgi:hypothetical protein
MDAQLRVETGSSVACGEEDAVHQTAAQCQERERRRIQFRTSLDHARSLTRNLRRNQARASLARIEDCARPLESVRQSLAEVREPKPAQLIVELARV